MKRALSYIVCLLFALFAHLTSHAQEAADFGHANGFEEKSDVDGSTEVFSDPDNKSFNATTTKTNIVKDSVASRVPLQRAKAAHDTTGKPQNQPATTEDDSILSFNFLYYIIQKFKMQDIIE